MYAYFAFCLIFCSILLLLITFTSVFPYFTTVILPTVLILPSFFVYLYQILIIFTNDFFISLPAKVRKSQTEIVTSTNSIVVGAGKVLLKPGQIVA